MGSEEQIKNLMNNDILKIPNKVSSNGLIKLYESLEARKNDSPAVRRIFPSYVRIAAFSRRKKFKVELKL